MHGINLINNHIANELLKTDKYIHLYNIRKQTGKDYQLVEKEKGYKLEVRGDN